MQSDTKKRIGVLRGGAGKHYAHSLKKGGEIIAHLTENLVDKYKALDILVDKEGIWHLNGRPVKPADLMHQVDLVWNTAEPGISVTLDNLSIPNIGASYFSSVAENSKDMLREQMQKIGVSMPRSIILPVYQKDFDGERSKYAIKKAKEVHQKLAGPWVVKSFTEDSNMGIHLAKTFNELVDGIEDGVKHEQSVIVEEFIAGKVASVHSVPGFRGESVYTFPVGNIFGNMSADEKEKLASLAKTLHIHVGAKHYLKSNFLVNKKGKIYFLDFESAPNLEQYSNFSEVCELVGAKIHDVVEHILERALNN